MNAVEIRRAVGRGEPPPPTQPDLAQSLTNLSNRLAEAGRKKESDALGDIGRYLLEGSNVIGPRPLPGNSIVSAGVQIVRGIYRGAWHVDDIDLLSSWEGRPGDRS